MVIDMKRHLFIFLLVFFSVITNAEKPKKTNEFLLQNQQAGKLIIGMTVDELYDIYSLYAKKLVNLYIESMFTPAIEIYMQNYKSRKPSIVAEFRGDNHKIWLINVRDKRFKTDKGIGIGSSLGDLKKAYLVDRIDWGERGFFARVNVIKMTFMLDTTAPPEWYKEKNSKFIPDDAIINSIYLD